MSKYPLNFSSIAYDIIGPQVHADGEICVGHPLRHPLRLFAVPATAPRTCAKAQPSSALRRATDPVSTPAPATAAGSSCTPTRCLLMPVRSSYARPPQRVPRSRRHPRFGGANQDLALAGVLPNVASARRSATTTGVGDGNPRSVLLLTSPRERDTRLSPRSRRMRREHPCRRTSSSVTTRRAPHRSPTPTRRPLYPTSTTPSRSSLPWPTCRRPGQPHKAYNFVANAPRYAHVRFKSPRSSREKPATSPSSSRRTTRPSPRRRRDRRGDDHNLLIDDTEGTNCDFSGAPVQAVRSW